MDETIYFKISVLTVCWELQHSKSAIKLVMKTFSFQLKMCNSVNSYYKVF